jgi:predicted phage gp36 major capsid-like protein
MALHRDSMERPLGTSLKATYRALLARGLEAGEAANLTAFLHGLPSDGFHWTLPEVEAIIRRRLAHAADERLAAATNNLAVPPRDRRRSTIHDRRSARSGSTHVIDPPNP